MAAARLPLCLALLAALSPAATAGSGAPTNDPVAGVDDTVPAPRRDSSGRTVSAMGTAANVTIGGARHGTQVQISADGTGSTVLGPVNQAQEYGGHDGNGGGAPLLYTPVISAILTSQTPETVDPEASTITQLLERNRRTTPDPTRAVSQALDAYDEQRGVGGVGGGPGKPPYEVGLKPADVDKGYKADPKDPYVNRVIGVRKAWEGDHAGALPHLQAAIDGGMTDPKTLTYAALSALNTGDLKRAANWSKAARDSDPNGKLAGQADAINKLAVRRLGNGPAPKEDKAPPAEDSPPRRARDAAPDTSILDATKALVNSAREAARVRDFANAARLAGLALDKDPDDVAARNLRAGAYLRLGRYKDAYDDAGRGLDLAPNYFPLMLAKALAAARTGRYDEAWALAGEVLRASPGNLAAARILALAAAGRKDREAMAAALGRAGALDVLRRARALPPDSDATLLFSDAFLFGGKDAGFGAAPPPGRRAPQRPFAVLGISALSAALVGGLILLLGRREKELPAPVPAAPAGDRLGPFRLLGTLGAGGMGVVYKAEDTSLDRLVALKRMRDEIAADPRERERFLKEARIVSGLDHPGIVRIHSICEGPEGTFLVFEYVEGRTLSQAIGERGRFTLPEARAILAQCAEAVAYAHSKGVVHRDLKPSNIMLDDQGRVRVMDFGVARAAKDALTRLTAQATVAGTPPYMSPEQEEGVTSPACDVYALGVCLYEMLTGRLPLRATGAALLLAKQAGKLPPLSEALGAEAPAGVDAVLANALAPDPKKRFASPLELAAALDGVPA